MSAVPNVTIGLSLRRAGRILIASVVALVGVGIGAGHAPASTAATPRPVFFGIYVPHQSLSAVPEVTAAAGTAPSVFSLFVTYDSGFTTSTLTNVYASGATPFVTFEPWSWTTGTSPNQPQYSLSTIYSGRYDTQLRTLARAIAAYQRGVYFRFAHEMNGWWMPWAESVNGNKPGDYVKAWRHVHDLFASVGATNARWVWSPAQVMSHVNETPMAELYPGDGYVNYVGMSCYGHSGTAATTCGATLTGLSAITTKHVILSEIGADGTNQANWITSLAPFISTNPNIIGFVWFNTTPETTGATGHYMFTDTPASVTAFRGMLAALGI
ncbi:MAG: hypothetical protein M3N95_02500 [Actinomycetota bacterium]|nr:hypothetical protein [Actinomycetota bacterium]